MSGASRPPHAALPGGFRAIPQLIAEHARVRPDQTALIHDARSLSYAELDESADRIAAALQRDGVKPRDIVAICAATSCEYVATFLGALRAGAAVAPLPVTGGARALAAMIEDAAPARLILDRSVAAEWMDSKLPGAATAVLLDDPGPGGLRGWMAAAGHAAATVGLQPEWPFNVIYSSGTTGVPKGIVQPHEFRWWNARRAALHGYDCRSVTLLATPLYSNPTLATMFGAMALGGTIVLLGKFAAAAYLELAVQYRATHTVLVPVQYQRLLADENFDRIDLSSFAMKFSTGALLPQPLKEQLLRRWPGGLIDIYGMTEGGVTCALEAHRYPGKLHTVGTPLPGHELRVIDAAECELAAGEAGEIVGRSPAMMAGYLNQPSMTRAAEWHDAAGRRFIRTGDIGRVDPEGFLVLLDRKKDVIISGGFNIYPSDLEAVLREHCEVAEAAVVGAASPRWGESPVACVVLEPGATVDAGGLIAWANARLGKMQRLAGVRIMASLPRNAAGKVLKRELRDSTLAPPPAAHRESR